MHLIATSYCDLYDELCQTTTPAEQTCPLSISVLVRVKNIIIYMLHNTNGQAFGYICHMSPTVQNIAVVNMNNES